MLADLRIENLALVERANPSFTSGLNVISGETGTGKTILVQALTLAAGGRADKSWVRTGTDEALIEARFLLSERDATRINAGLAEMGLPQGGHELIVRRRVTRDGRSRVYINDASATLTALQSCTTGLIELTGQHDQYGLLRPECHLSMLDAFAEVAEERALVSAAVRALRESERRYQALEESLASRAERHEFLRFYLREFEALAPEPREDEALLEEANRLANAEHLRFGLAGAVNALYESGGSVYDRLTEASDEIGPLLEADRRLEGVFDNLAALQASVDDLRRELSRYAADAVGDPVRLEVVQSRLHKLQRFCRKHGGTLEGVTQKMEAAAQELSGLSTIEDSIEAARGELAKARSEAVAACERLTKARRDALPRLVESTHLHLADLGFEGASFSVDMKTHNTPESLTVSGADKIAFLLTANVGEPAKALAKVASGGELSRLLLALKCALAAAEGVAIHVFDEVDTGIGGSAAEVVGRKIRELADTGQVLCVTHLPQIASFADTHHVVSKETADSRTRSRLTTVEGRAREDELARMLGGTEITEATREHAREMLGRARPTG
jgi:DNA repair protein RecN (Recombination protein N)